MRKFKEVSRVFIKSTNKTTKIFNRYLYALIPFVIFYVIYNLIWGSNEIVINLLKQITLSLLVAISTKYIISIIKKEKNIYKTLLKDNTLTIAIIISLFSINNSLIITIIATILSIAMRSMLKNTTTSSSLYGILFILISSYFFNDVSTPLNNLKELKYVSTYDNIIKSSGNFLTLSLGTKYYLSPIISIITFIYLFYKKSIKYTISFSYILTFSSIMLFVGLFNHMNLWYLFYQLCTGNILFLSVFCLTDYPSTPITYEGQLIYGIILGLLTSILRFIIPELSVVIPLIIGPILLTKKIDELSIKLKNNKKNYYIAMSLSVLAVLFTTVIINIII